MCYVIRPIPTHAVSGELGNVPNDLLGHAGACDDGEWWATLGAKTRRRVGRDVGEPSESGGFDPNQRAAQSGDSPEQTGIIHSTVWGRRYVALSSLGWVTPSQVTRCKTCPTAQGRINEMEAEQENVRSTIERVFKAELLKITPSLQNTLIGDLISGNSPLSLESNLTEYLCWFFWPNRVYLYS